MPQKITLSGTIIDNDTQQPLEYATITFQNPQRPNMLQGGITDANGKFEIEIFPGRYTLKAEYISFEPYTKELAPYRENQDLGVIGLSISDNALEEVQVMGERTEVEFRLDKRIYNVGRDITVRGGSVADVLDNVPSVSVDIDGNVALRGNDNVRILINGKPSGLVGISGPEGLRQLPAESIEKVEVVTSPSARYDAEGTAGLLNIILKKEELEGVNGTFSANVGTPKNNRASANLNWRTKKINIFTTNTFSDDNNKGRGYDDNVYFNGAAPDTYLEEIDESNRGRKSFFSRLGLEYYINDKSSVIFSGFYRNSDGENNSLNEIRELGANRDVYSFTTRENLESELDESLQYSIDYTNKFDDKGHELTARFQYEESNEDEQSQIEAKGFLPTVIPSSFETVGNLEFQKRMLMQADYVWPIDENTQFELGYRGNFNTQETDYEVAYLNNGIPTIDRDLSNVLVYKEFVNAAYSQYGKKINNFSFLFGLRMEHSNIQIDQRTTNDYTQKKYTDWFPTANFSYEINERESVTLGLSRRLRRPRSRFINPFPSRSSITNLFMGNPDLNPTYTGNLDFGYLKRWEKYT
ncbi:MAG: outer membrane beta-barrel protein, partial [Flavobacteriaceae bacterium]